jgi:hypothetical protein
MESLPRLKKKDELRYRKGSTNKSFNCVTCLHFVKYEEPPRSPEVVLSLYGLCKLFGVKESIRYRVRKDYMCDAHVFDESKCWWMTAAAARKLLSEEAKP